MIQVKNIFIITLFLSINISFAQSNKEITELKTVVTHEHKNHQLLTGENNNEVQMFFSGLFLFYKTFISSQDNSSCSFSPSCSEYGMIAVKNKGVLKGMMMTFDRLTRCNGLNRKDYPVNRSNGLLIDPV